MKEKPEVKPVDAIYLPEELTKTAKFCNWRYEPDSDRNAWTKIPYDPKTGRRASSTDPDTFADLSTALKQEHNYDGVGVGIFGQLAAVDIDHCIDEDGNLSDLAQDIVKTMDAYTEKSPSRTGIRILFTVPAGYDYDAEQTYYKKNPNNGVEIYVAGKTSRFVTLTGDVLAEERGLEERGGQLRGVLDKYMRRPDRTTADTKAQPVDMEDDALIKKALASRDPAFVALWAGDTSGYNDDDSSADQALCNKLAFWTGKDPERMDRIFRKSGLYRDKWDRDDYRDRTIRNAIATCTEVFTPKREKTERPRLSAQAVSVWKYITGGGFAADLAYFSKYQDRKTGFLNLDRYLTLYPGLAALGGAASLGKTTFLVNLADNLVLFGECVLYFTLEQLPAEIVTKSLARRLAERYPDTPLDNTKIKNGSTSAELERVKREYAEAVEKKFYIVKCDFRTTAEDIRDCVADFIEQRGIRPVVIVDYLQLVAPPDDFRGDQRAILDYNIKLFKTVQLENELLMILVSNFNRSGYDTPVSYDAFKESGMIEYTCDYIWGLQLSLLSEDRFYFSVGSKGGKQKTTEIEQDAMLEAAIKENPKKVQLVSLKNRNGPQRFRCNFEYYPEYDYFRDCETENPYETGELEFK